MKKLATVKTEPKLNLFGKIMNAPTSKQIDAEVKKLERLRRTTPDTHTGRLINDQIKAQIQVLSQRMTGEERKAEFSDGNEDVAEAALNAWEWMQGDGHPPESKGWPGFIEGAENCVCLSGRPCPCLLTKSPKVERELRMQDVDRVMKHRREQIRRLKKAA